MTNLALSLAWKHNNAEGIATRDGVIFEWPDSLGAEPDAAAQATIIAEYEAHVAATAYREKRATEYPEIGDQLDDLYRKGAFSDAMAAQLKAVKDKYPKE